MGIPAGGAQLSRPGRYACPGDRPCPLDQAGAHLGPGIWRGADAQRQDHSLNDQEARLTSSGLSTLAGANGNLHGLSQDFHGVLTIGFYFQPNRPFRLQRTSLIVLRERGQRETLLSPTEEGLCSAGRAQDCGLGLIG